MENNMITASIRREFVNRLTEAYLSRNSAEKEQRPEMIAAAMEKAVDQILSICPIVEPIWDKSMIPAPIERESRMALLLMSKGSNKTVH